MERDQTETPLQGRPRGTVRRKVVPAHRQDAGGQARGAWGREGEERERQRQKGATVETLEERSHRDKPREPAAGEGEGHLSVEPSTQNPGEWLENHLVRRTDSGETREE